MRIFNRKEVASIFGVKPNTLYKWEKKGLIKPAGYVTNRPFYHEEDVLKLGADKPRTNQTENNEGRNSISDPTPSVD